MISLEEVKPFAEGGNRVCYIHPNNKSLCLKISKPEVVKKMRSNAPWYKKLRSKRSFDDNYREESAYQQRAIKENPQKIWKHLAKWYKFVETSKGWASCTELITNNDKVALNLEEYLFSRGRTTEINNALKDFRLKKTDKKIHAGRQIKFTTCHKKFSRKFDTETWSIRRPGSRSTWP